MEQPHYPLLLRGVAADIALRFGLRRTRGCWRGNCPRCGGQNTLKVSAAGADAARAYCGSCRQPALIQSPEVEKVTANG